LKYLIWRPSWQIKKSPGPSGSVIEMTFARKISDQRRARALRTSGPEKVIGVENEPQGDAREPLKSGMVRAFLPLTLGAGFWVVG